MPETTPLIKAALNLRVGAGFDVYDIPKTDFDTIAELIANDGYDVSAFELLEIPHPKVFCFGNEEKGEYFDVVKFFDDKWQFSYIENGSNKLAHSIEEAIMKNEWLK